MAQKLKAIADGLGKSVAQLAINWAIRQPGVAAAICGAKRAEQIAVNVGGAGWPLSAEDLARVTRIVDET